MKDILTLVIGTAALLLAGQAVAQTPAPPVAPGTVDPNASLVTLDADKDGSISRAEAASNASLSSQFLTLDSNGNGALESAEFSRFEATGITRPTTGTTSFPPNTITPPPPMTPTVPAGSSPAPTGSTPAPTGSTPPPGR